MTCRELAKIEHPDRIDPKEDGGVFGCPYVNLYGYLESETGHCPKNITCENCWDQEADAEAVERVTKAMTEAVEKIEQTEYPERKILDSGDRTEFASGAVRDMREGKGRCDLLPLDVIADAYMRNFHSDSIYGEAIFDISKFQERGDVAYLFEAVNDFQGFDSWSDMFLEVAKHFEEGAKKYGCDNWKKGIPANIYIDSAVRHYLKFLRGDKDEPHDRAFCWNILCCIWTCKHHPELNVYARKESDEADA